MSRIGKLPIPVPNGVTITVDQQLVTVTGPKGTLACQLLPGITATQDNGHLVVARSNEEAEQRSKHGLLRSLINNMVIGVTQGFSKKLEIVGVGYRAAMQGANIKLNLGFSHDVIFAVPQNITAVVEQNAITISGIDKQLVGQVAADIRALKKPEPYKGKGIKYAGEHIVRKSGKSGKDKK